MKRTIALLLIIVLSLSALSVTASADTLGTGRILVGLKKIDTPVCAKDLLPGFELENGDALYGNDQSGSSFVLRLCDKNSSATDSAIRILESHPAVESACSEEYVAKESAPGQVLVIPKTIDADMNALFEDFAIESIRQLMKADRGYPPIYLVIFEEKTSTIVMDAIEALSQKVRVIEPDWKEVSAEPDPVIYFDANNTYWKDFDQIYCHIFGYNEDSFFEWQTKRERCTKENKDGLWSYHLDDYGIRLEDGKTYIVMFSSPMGDTTYYLLFDKSCYGDTVYVTGELVESLYGPQYPDLSLVRWVDSDPEVYGPMLNISDGGNVIGEVCHPATTPSYLLKSVLSDPQRMENIRTSTGMNDQELVDHLKAGLSLDDFEVEQVIGELKDPIEWKADQRRSFPLNDQVVSPMLMEMLREYPYSFGVTVYIEYADDKKIAPPDTDDPLAINRYHEELEERENRLFDELFDGIYANVILKGMSDGVIVLVDSENIGRLSQSDAVKSIDFIDNFENPGLRGYVGPGNRFAREFERQYGIDVFENSCAKYDEVCYHYDKNGEIDWAIVNYASFSMIGNDVVVSFILCDKHIFLPSDCYRPFIYGYGLYDAKTKTFTDLRYLYLFDEYAGLEEAFRSLDLSHLSPCTMLEHNKWGSATDLIRGDADGDRRVTVLDATKIQKCRANLVSRYELMTQNADTDGDGIVTILDATRIQKYKANICDLDGKPNG